MIDRLSHYFKAYTSLLFLMAVAVVPSEAGQFDSIELRSSKGAKVEIVAIHSIGPNGLTFSPKPTKPLIGSNKLQTMTTEWSNIDVSSIKSYPELAKAYSQGENGKTSSLNFGPHFYKISESMERISKDLPNARYWVNGEMHSMSLERLVSKHGKHRPNKWSIPTRERDKTLTVWKKEFEDLEALNYRSDVIRFRDKLYRAIRSLERITAQEQAFNISAARNLSQLLTGE